MKCAVGGLHLRVFGRAIHAIARISDEFWLDPIEKGLALRSVNSSRSAYACVFFSSMFFQHYRCVTMSEVHQGERQLHFPCKLVMKSVLPIFRCLNTLERNVEKCNIYTNLNDCHVIFQLFCKHGVIKTHNLTFQECDPLQAVFAKHMCPNILKVQSRLLADIMIHFPTCQEEVTLAITPMKVCFKSYTEEERDFSKAMHTEIQLHPEEFDYFQVGVDSEVTFCLRELRGLFAFAEATTAPVSIHFDVSGKPIAFSIEDMMMEATFVLATLADIEHGISRQSPCLSQRQKSTTSRKWFVNCYSLRSTLTKAFADKTENAPNSSADKNSNSEGISSKKLCWNRSMCNCAESSELPNLPSRREAAGDSTMVEAVVPTDSDHHKFHSLFFGAVSLNDPDVNSHTFHSLATASDTEEDFDNRQLSPVIQ